MTGKVQLNSATHAQLRALWKLTGAEADAVVRARSFASGAEAGGSLARRPGPTLAPEASKLDINARSATALAVEAGISEDLASRIAAQRPYFNLAALSHVPGVDGATFQRISELFGGPQLRYVDKASGRQVELAPRPDEMVVRIREQESAGLDDAAGRLRLNALGRGQGIYRQFRAPQSETGTGSAVALRRDPAVEQVIPAFVDDDGAKRYIDPEYCVVQFALGVPTASQALTIAGCGLEIRERHRTEGLVTLRVPEAATDPAAAFRAIECLNGSDDVVMAEPAFLGFDDRESGHALGDATSSWNLRQVSALDAWTYGLGSPDVLIAIIDSGVEADHPALTAAVLTPRQGEDWNFENDATTPTDEDGHGTFIAGVLVGNGTGGIQGICPGCRVLPLKIPLSASPTSYARRRDAILYALDCVSDGQRLVINLSWKTTGDVGLVREAIQTALVRGALVVGSAGNWPERVSQPHYPSDYDGVISVAGVGPDGARGSYSYYGDKVDVAAPGGAGDGPATANIVSAALAGGARADYGTSFAAPHVAGVAALIWSRAPQLRADEVRAAIETHATRAEEGLGKGIVNALASLVAVVPSRPAPAVGGQRADGLRVVNSWDIARLTAVFGLTRFTARLLVSRRPYVQLDQLRGTSGLTPSQFDALGSYADASATREPVNVNLASLDELDAVPGMPSLTARLVVSRRPHATLQTLARITGMTPEVLQQLALP